MRSRTRRSLRFFAALVLLLVSAAGTFHAVRAAAAAALYHRVKYGRCHSDPVAIFRVSEQSIRLYPLNYYLCIWAAETAYYTSLRADTAEAERRLKIAEYWCDKGLYLNEYKSQLCLLKARLLRRRSPAAAAAYWREYVDWHFWEPYNHAVLVDLYAQSGDYDRALRALQWVKGSPYEEQARAWLRDAWKKEREGVRTMAAPAGPGTPAGLPRR